MYAVLYQYLGRYQHVDLPGIGTFSIDRKPATYQGGQNVYLPPAYRIQFKAEATVPEKQFYHFIAHNQQIEEVEAIRSFNDFVYNLKQELGLKRTIELPGIGIINKNAHGEMDFVADESLQAYYPVLPANTVIQTGGQQSFDTKEISVSAKKPSFWQRNYWWILAVLLALIAIAAIGLYYTRYGRVL